MINNEELIRLVQEVLRKTEKPASNDYSVYMLTNNTKQEIYIGVSNQVLNRITQHAQKKTKTIAHWTFESDDIKQKILHTDLTQSEASDKAHGYESQDSSGIDGYTVIQTAGI
jgi:hypothetical protein